MNLMQDNFPLYKYIAVKKGFQNHFVIILKPTAKMNLCNKIEADRIHEDFPLAPKFSQFVAKLFASQLIAERRIN